MFQNIYYNISSSLSKLTCTFFQTSATSVGVQATAQYIQSLKVIRLLLDNGPNFGNQAASASLCRRLREMGFTGVIELVYPQGAITRLEILFNTTIKKTDFLDENLNIRFITEHVFSKLRGENQIPVARLGMTGAIDDGFKNLYKILNAKFFNVSNSPTLYLNTDVFIQYSSYHGDYWPGDRLNPVDTEIYLKGHDIPIRQTDSRFHALITPQISGELARKKLISEKPAFATLLPSIDKGMINVLPVYGRSTHKDSFNLLNILLGARYAQVHGLKKPLIMVLLYDIPLDKLFELHQLLSFLDSSPESLNEDQKVVHATMGAVNVRASLRNLALTHNFSVKSLSDLDQAAINDLDPNSIVLTSTGRLSQDAFHYIYAYLSPSTLAPVFEGASSFKHLSTASERPHLYCAATERVYWPLNFSSINGTVLHQRMMNLTMHTCVSSGPTWLKSWETMNVAELIGTYFISAQDPQSEVSVFFKNHHKELLRTDRIMSGLIVATQLANRTQEESLGVLAPYLYLENGTDSKPVPVASHTEALCEIQPSEHEPTTNVLRQAVGLGVVSGLSETLQHGLQRKGFSYQAAAKAKQVAYYVGVFGWNFCTSFSNKASSENVLQQVTESAVEAGLNTAKSLVINTGISIVSKTLDLCGTQGRVGRAAQFVKGCLRYGMFAVNSIHDPQAAVVSLVVGGVSEAATATVGKKIVDLTVNKSPSL